MSAGEFDVPTADLERMTSIKASEEFREDIARVFGMSGYLDYEPIPISVDSSGNSCYINVQPAHEPDMLVENIERDLFPIGKEEEALPDAPVRLDSPVLDHTSVRITDDEWFSCDESSRVLKKLQYQNRGGMAKKGAASAGRSATPNSVTTVRTATQANSSGSRWYHDEEVVLTGVVMDFYYRRHSIKATQQEREEARRTGIAVDTIVWSKIHAMYEQAAERLKIIRPHSPVVQKRTAVALQKHWKENGRKRKADNVDGEEYNEVPVTKNLEREWDTKYNVDFILSCGEEQFAAKLAGLQLQKEI